MFPSLLFALNTAANPPLPMNSASGYRSDSSGGRCWNESWRWRSRSGGRVLGATTVSREEITGAGGSFFVLFFHRYMPYDTAPRMQIATRTMTMGRRDPPLLAAGGAAGDCSVADPAVATPGVFFPVIAGVLLYGRFHRYRLGHGCLGRDCRSCAGCSIYGLSWRADGIFRGHPVLLPLSGTRHSPGVPGPEGCCVPLSLTSAGHDRPCFTIYRDDQHHNAECEKRQGQVRVITSSWDPRFG